eukprot:evm.model.scf_1540.1 EVM.evm.TU.scf_1540.1   scf_1540:9235-12428(-)
MVVVSESSPETRHAFVTEWLDPNSGIRWTYQLFHYPAVGEVEMHDVKNRRMFLKRCRSDLRPGDLYVGATVSLFARHLKITDYGDDATRAALEPRAERTCAIVKPDGVERLGRIMHAIGETGLAVASLRMAQLTRGDAEAFYGGLVGKPFFGRLVEFMSGGRVVAMELVGPGAVARWRQALGPTDSEQARAEAPESIRAAFGTDGTMNACHGSDSPAAAAEELNFFFGSGSTVRRCGTNQGTTLAIVKPHAVRDGATGLIVDLIQEKFSINAMEMLSLDQANAAEFYEVYRGVVNPAEYNGMVDELISGLFIVMEVADRDSLEAVEPFREFCGPADPEIARVLRPKSLRARFGVNKVQNAVHCTDLPEDGELEVSYFFTVMQN